uniref:Uncharacterized protein n=1 Tax=Timema douglasi TaxID=61478 RepID=A0A7R8VRC3_TIMDO|nr:unnamed protein product [Timema douglasi]
MPADTELSSLLNRRQAINEALGEGKQVDPQFKPVKKNIYSEFHEFTRRQIKEYESTFNSCQSAPKKPWGYCRSDYKTSSLSLKQWLYLFERAFFNPDTIYTVVTGEDPGSELFVMCAVQVSTRLDGGYNSLSTICGRRVMAITSPPPRRRSSISLDCVRYYSSPVASLVLTDSSQLTSDSQHLAVSQHQRSHGATVDSVHHAGTRLATVAFRASPVVSICADTRETALSYRRGGSTLEHLMCKSSITCQDMYLITQYSILPTVSRMKPNVVQTLLGSGCYVFETCGLVFPEAISSSPGRVSPWKIAYLDNKFF